MKKYKLTYCFCLLLLMLCVPTMAAQEVSVKQYENIPVYFPLDKNDFVKVSSPYGYRNHPIFKKHRLHQGIDLVAIKGKPVYATASGTVIKSDFVEGYGNRILITHLEGLKTLYGHLLIKLVKKGEQIKQGQIIGLVGDTGNVTGPHLHFEIWLKNKRVDPVRVWKKLLKKEYQEIVMNQ